MVTQELKAITESADPDKILSRCKSISALLPYVIRPERDSEKVTVEAVLHARSPPELRNTYIGPRWKTCQYAVQQLEHSFA
jgi:hypothetical protein